MNSKCSRLKKPFDVDSERYDRVKMLNKISLVYTSPFFFHTHSYHHRHKQAKSMTLFLNDYKKLDAPRN